MMNILRDWGFPVGLVLIWTIAVAFTLHALVDMQSTLQSTQVPSQSAQVERQPIAAGVLNTAPA